METKKQLNIPLTTPGEGDHEVHWSLSIYDADEQRSGSGVFCASSDVGSPMPAQ